LIRVGICSILIFAVLLFLATFSPPAECVYCPTWPCYGEGESNCGHGCVCITPPGQSRGQCWGWE
jgi:hypothetical protein